MRSTPKSSLPRSLRRKRRSAAVLPLAAAGLLGVAALGPAAAASPPAPPMPPAPPAPMRPPGRPVRPAQGQLSSAVNMQVASTVPPNGDTNPYGVAIVPTTAGNLVAGDVLVTNFNNRQSDPGAGTTIVQIDPTTGSTSLFYQGSQSLVGPDGIVLNPAKDILWVGDYGPANSSGVYDG
ncbi:MAG: hypothetical protein M0T80_13380, partial [Actinomycetota bacterium]|nr:hypothetical protein [Actinomycetota bacterium]